MISRQKAKFITSLQRKKVREEERLFVIEGDKLVREFLGAGVQVRTLVAKPEFLSSLSQELISSAEEIEEINYDDLKKISTLQSPHNALAIVPMPDRVMNTKELFKNLCVALDLVQDPGNLGTIIRAAGWFGITNIVCSRDCVDVYNPKVVQASMGALLQVKVYYSDLVKLLSEAKTSKIPVFGAVLEGDSIYNSMLGNKGIILLGNESRGISESLIPFITEKIMIPRYSSSGKGIDSLNVGMAASVIFSEFLRRGTCSPE